MHVRAVPALLVLAGAVACSPFPRPSSAPGSTTVDVLSTGHVLALDADHDELVWVDPVTRSRSTLALGGTPGRMSQMGGLAVVSLPWNREVVVVDLVKRSVLRRIRVGVEPMHLAWVNPTQVAVVLEGDKQLVTFNPWTGSIQRRVAVDLHWPRAMAVHNGHALVVDMLDGAAANVNLADGSVRKTEVARTEGTAPTLIHHVSVDRQGGAFLVPSTQLGRSADGRPSFQASASEAPVYYGPKPTPAVAVTGLPADPDEEMDPTGMGGSGTGSGSPGGEPMSEPMQVAMLDRGRAMAVLFRGSRRVIVWGTIADRGVTQTCDTPMASVRVGHGADGMAVSPDGDRLVVHNAADLTVTMIDIPALPPAGVCFALGQSWTARTLSYGALDLPEQVAEGRRLFYDGTNLDLTTVGITCAFCHVEGRTDDRVWEAPDGPRNTPTLVGAGPGRIGIATTTAPLHWSGDFTTHRDLDRTVTNVMVGGGLNAQQADQLAAFIDTIRVPDNALPEDPETQAAVEAGRVVFESAEAGCTGCHAGAHFTDNLNHDVGTGESFQTPVLHSLERTAPYLHDGRAATLEQMLDMQVRTDRMGRGSHLTDTEMHNLAMYLRSL